MKKLVSTLLALVMALSLVACGGSAKESRINIVGVFYGDCGAEDGFQDLYVVFDYTNDETNRTMPEETSLVSMTVNETNVYQATENENHTYYHHGEYEMTDYGWFERYTGYRYVVGYGTLLGGADPVRMFVHFTFNPNDLNNSEKLTLTVEDQVAEFPTAEIQEISIVDEILKCEENFEASQMAGAVKWRLDSAYRVVYFLKGTTARFGSSFSAMASGMKTLFSAESKGVSLMDAASFGVNSKTYTYNTVVDTLPAYDHELMLQLYPEVADEITALVNDWTALASALENPNSTASEVYALMDSILNHYHTIFNTWGMEYAPQ